MSRMLKLSAETGGKYLTYIFFSVGAGVAVGNLAPHTLFKDHYANLFQLYRRGFPVEVPSNLETMLSEISDELSIPIKNPLTRLFTVIGFDTMLFGSTSTNDGCAIGIPENFTYNSVKDIDRLSIQIENKSVPWDSVDGENLANSLILSELAKKFGIAYELALADTNKLFLHSVIGPVIVILCGFINNYFCDVFGLPFRPILVKSVFYGLLLLFGSGFYLALRDLITNYYEVEALKKVCEGGEQYITGGLEFYEQLIARNKALRNLFSKGTKEFNFYGDPIYFFRRKHVPITDKIKLLKEEFENLKQNTM